MNIELKTDHAILGHVNSWLDGGFQDEPPTKEEIAALANDAQAAHTWRTLFGDASNKLAAHAPQQSDEIIREQALMHAQAAARFFACVIKSGERWSDECEKMLEQVRTESVMHAPQQWIPVSDLRDALRKYGMHRYHECLYKWVPDASYEQPTHRGRWEHRGPITECRCGLAQLLAAPPVPDTPAKPPTLTERRAEFVYDAARLAAIAAQAPIVPVPWREREAAFRNQFLDVIGKQCGPYRSHSPEELHEAWVAAYLAMGWEFGEKYDRAAKIHPDMVPYAKLGQLERDKDAVFVALCEIARQWIYAVSSVPPESDACIHCQKDLVAHHARNLRCPDGRSTIFNRAAPRVPQGVEKQL